MSFMTIILDDRFTISLRAENILDMCFERQQIRAKTFCTPSPPLQFLRWGYTVRFEFTKINKSFIQ